MLKHLTKENKKLAVYIYDDIEYKLIYRGDRVTNYLNKDGVIASVNARNEIKFNKGSFQETSKNKTIYRRYVTNTNIFKKKKQMKVHRLVMLLFSKELMPPDKQFVSHINDNALDNRLENLRWASRKDNANNHFTKRKRKKRAFYRKHFKQFKITDLEDKTRFLVADLDVKVKKKYGDSSRYVIEEIKGWSDFFNDIL